MGDEPDALADLFDADSLDGQGFSEADPFSMFSEPSAARDRYGLILEGILKLADTGIGAR
jgi:hypothetical protein